MSILDRYQAIDEVVMQHKAGAITAEKAMEYVSEIVADEEGEE